MGGQCHSPGRTFGQTLKLRILIYGCVFIATAIMWNWDAWTWFESVTQQPAPAILE